MVGGRGRLFLIGAVMLGSLGMPSPAVTKPRAVELTLDRLTYVDGTYRGTSEDFAWLGFDGARSSESVGADVPGTRTSYMVVPTAVPEHFESLTVDLRRRGDLLVVMTGRHTGNANPRAVPDSANRNGRTKGRQVIWRIKDAQPGSDDFTARFKPRTFEPNLNTFLPESRISLTSSEGTTRLVMKQHAASVYGPPSFYTDGPYGPLESVSQADEWVGTASYVAQGNYNWATGRVGWVEEVPFSRLAPGSGDAFNTGSMGTGTSTLVTGPKVNAFMDFTYGRRFRPTGFLFGLVVADPVGEFAPFDTSPNGGTIYDGDAGTFPIGMNAASVHARDKRFPENDRGELVWDWDGERAEGWGTKDEHLGPGRDREIIEPVLGQETVIYARAVGGDVDNREGSKPIKGPRLILKFPRSEFGFIFHSAVGPPNSGYRPQTGFTKDGQYFMRPTIVPGGYMLEGTQDDYFRDWQAAALVSASFFGAQPKEQPSARRLFVFPPNTQSEVVAATTTGVIERFVVGPGMWELVAEPSGFELSKLRVGAPVGGGSPLR